MAEFKLGRIRFIWKGNWAASTVYYKDDIVRNGGNTYVCIAGHTAPALFTDSQSTYWNKITDGQDWKGDWATSTYYKVNDIVKYGGYLYVANEAHTSAATETLGLEDDQSKWDLFAEGFDYKANWETGTRYKINDIVKYNGTVYICTLEHTSAATEAEGLEVNNGRVLTVDNISNPDPSRTPGTYTGLLPNGGTGSGLEVTATVAVGGGVSITITGNGTRYLVGETVSLTDEQLGDGGAAVVTFDIATTVENWDVFSEGFFWTGTWDTEIRYRRNDVVRYGGQLYVCNTGHTSAATETLGLEDDQSKWDYLHKGVEFLGDWAADTRYKVNDVVKYGGGIWICTDHHTSTVSLLDDEANWDQFVEGLEFEDSWSHEVSYQPGDFVTYGGYSYVAKTNNLNQAKPNVNSTDWELFTTGFRFLGDYADDSTNEEYVVGDVVRLGGYTYLCTADNQGERPPNALYWERLNSGFMWKGDWTDATFYDAGDSVQHGVNSYVCILAHTSDETVDQNRPDQDVTGVNWNLLVAGAESGNLTTEGDLVYYGGAGPTRLPLGQVGQGLRVNAAGDAPEWAYFGAINNVFYVSTLEGIDNPAPDYGISIDRPWKTVRHATEQVQAGALYYNAKSLIERNRAFIQEEVVEYINTTYPALVYTEETCRRDVGQVVDAVVWDLSHGGNERSRAAAISYFDTDGTTYLADNATETAAGLNYIKTVVDAVISNVAPDTVYGSIAQVVDTSFTEEADALSIVESLVDIVTDAITAGDTTGVPAQKKPQHTIFVKTGEFAEVLPIIVPENTAIVGDELRSTRIVPAGSLVDSADTPYSLDAISRLQAIIPNIITNTPVTKTTTGASPNTETQDTTGPAGSEGYTANVPVVEALADEMVDILENGVGNADALTFTDTGVAAKTTARTELQADRATILSDMDTWLQANTALDAGERTTCLRDVGYIVDGLSYDIQYGGNWATTINARSYYTGVVSNLPAGQVTDTVDALTELKTIVNSYLSGATEEAEAGSLIDEIIDVIENGIENLATITYPDVSWATAALQAGHTSLLNEKSRIQQDAVEFVSANNDGLVFNKTTCSRDAGYIIDALAYDMALGSNFQSVTAGIRYYAGTESAQLVISDQLDATVGAINFIKYASKYAVAAGAGAEAAEMLQDITDWINFDVNATGARPVKTGKVLPTTDTGHTYAVQAIEANRAFIQAEIVAYIVDAYPSYTYDATACARDVDRYLDAIKWDLRYTGNYKSTLAARYYSNAVNGSLLEDMFYMRNGTGLRNCTVQGLTGTLGSANSYGTKRPTAGAFVSLDPGWGPYHTDAWISNRSPYIQNVTTFGTACVGCKIDGDLHAGGNDSIVANDFTQILSDGIGVWCTNLGRVELVSVFSYYGHIGYLSENGGKIRATNGNSSYGTYGTVAEGVDGTEVPITGTVNNYGLQAIVSNVLTDGNNILTFEYLNAGVNYTELGTTITAFGEGFGAEIDSPQISNGAVFEVRMLETVEDPSNFGGDGYISSENVAQGGDSTSITISNTDTRVDAAYVGMAIYITAGVGAGQYGYIDTYNSGTKLATIKKMSDDSAGWDHVIGTAIETTLNETTTYSIEPRLTFTAPPSGLYADTAKGRAVVADNKIANILIWDPGTGYSSAPTLTITDPNNTVEAPTEVRIGNGVLTQPTWTDRGTGMATAQATIDGDGYADRFQPGGVINVENLDEVPLAGSNITFDNIPGEYFKLVTVRSVQGTGPYSATFQVSPDISITDAPPHADPIELRIRYSQVRLTGHDFLDIGTGNFEDTNYPNTPVNPVDPLKETVTGGGGRVFYTSTDQDGNFRVGRLFNVEQSTGVATLNADAFNITGLNELQLGSVELGGTGAVITEFSTDGTFTANSDNIVPTQKAIKTYIASQIGGGAGELNVNSLTAGVVKVSGQQITTTTGAQINILQKVNFTGGITGAPVALNYFLSS
jgi:hypothetical protein